MDARKVREIAFHNHRFATGTRGVSHGAASGGVDKYYSVVERSRNFYLDLIQKGCQGKRVLEYGCGTGGNAFYLAKRGARVTGIDISDVAVKQAEQRAAAEAITDINFEVMDAEDLKFGEGTFDLICGTAILHHLDLRSALASLARALKTSGIGVFLEPLGHNPLINLYRKWTPGIRTPDEHPLLIKDFELAKAYFGSVEIHCFHLTSLLAVPFRRRHWFGGLVRGLGAFDDVLFRAIPVMKRYAWAVVVVLAQPKRETRHEAVPFSIT
jgi:SAM-dependent methyltransferase